MAIAPTGRWTRRVHVWNFSQKVKEVSVAEMEASSGLKASTCVEPARNNRLHLKGDRNHG